MSKDDKLTVADIEQWIDNDETLYRWRKNEGGSLRKFIKDNREALERHIRAVLDRKPAR